MSNNHLEMLNNSAAVGPQGEGMDSPSNNAGELLNNGVAVGPQGEGMDSPSNNTCELKKILTSCNIVSNIGANTPAMPLSEAHFGGFFVSGGCV